MAIRCVEVEQPPMNKNHNAFPRQGTIVWERWQLDEFLQARKRVCHVSNICWANGRLTMYVSLHPSLQRKHHVPNMYLPELANDFSWPQSTPEGFNTDGWDGMLHLHAFEKVSGFTSRF